MSQLHDQDQGSRNIFPGIPRVLLDDKFSLKTSESDEFENAMSTFYKLELIDDHEKEPSYFSRLQVTQEKLLTSGNINVHDMRRIPHLREIITLLRNMTHKT